MSNLLEKVKYDLQNQIDKLDRVDYENETEIDEALTLFSNYVENDKTFKLVENHIDEDIENILEMGLSNLYLISRIPKRMDNQTIEDKQKLLDIVQMSLMMAKTYFHLFQRLSTDRW